MAQILNGREASARYRQTLEKTQCAPCLAVIQVGEDEASSVYVGRKRKACASLGWECLHVHLPGKCSTQDVLDVISELGADDAVHGIMVQLPVSEEIDLDRVIDMIPLNKDVDGFKSGSPYVPCTALGIVKLLEYYNIPVAGKHAVVVGRSTIVGLPAASSLLAGDATVTICHSKTADLAAHTRQADILVVAAGKPNLITADMVKPGAVVIDAGMNRVDGKLVGDVDFEAVKDVAEWITPVPGGVGPMTVTGLLINTLEACKAVST